MAEVTLPVVRSGERQTYKRCVKKWYWAWRKGYVPRQKRFGALELGTWVHKAMASWYSPEWGGWQRVGTLQEHFSVAASDALSEAVGVGAPEEVVDKGYELMALGEEMLRAYEDYYGADDDMRIIGTEVPLEFTFSDVVTHEPKAIYRLTPDAVFDKGTAADGEVWLLEHKTAASINTEHLAIDGQARPYAAMAERALKEAGLIPPYAKVKGILYNYLRKALPDERPRNERGLYLNKNGTISKKQPPPLFLRKPIVLSQRAKIKALQRAQADARVIVDVAQGLRTGYYTEDHLPITSDKSCPRFCEFFAICAAQEDGVDTRDMERSMFVRQDPYAREETTDDPSGFEMG